jgi:membrane protein involved in colicin uptake
MSRNTIILMGILLWGAFAAMVLAHAISGDLAGPVVAMILVAAGLTLRQLGRRAPIAARVRSSGPRLPRGNSDEPRNDAHDPSF